MTSMENLVDEISKNSMSIEKELKTIKDETMHDNIRMILDYFVVNMQYMREALLQKKEYTALPELHDIKAYNSDRSNKLDPESMQSVLMYISGALKRNYEIIRGEITKLGNNEPYLENYVNNIDTLRKKAEHLYYDLVERS